MEGVVPVMARTHLRARDRVVAAFLLVLLVAGSLVFWIGLPLAVLYGLAQVTEDAAQHLVLGLLGVPLAMALFAFLLLSVNRLYLRVTGAYRYGEDEDEAPRLLRGPLEPILVVCFVVALIALLWFFVFGDQPQLQVL